MRKKRRDLDDQIPLVHLLRLHLVSEEGGEDRASQRSGEPGD